MVNITLPNNGDSGWGTTVNTAINAINAGKPDTTNLEINAKNYGALGNGIADDTSAIINAINAAGERGSVFLPAGTYKISAQLPVYSKFTLRGAGSGSTVINQVTAGTPIIVSRSYVSALSYTPSGGSTIRGLTLNGTTGTGCIGIILRDFSCTIDDVFVTNCGGTGIKITTQNDANTTIGTTLVENNISNSVVRNCGATGFYALDLGSDDNGKITGGSLTNVIIDTTSSTSLPDGHVTIGAAADWALRGIHTYGNVGLNSIRLSSLNNTSMTGLYIGSYGNSSNGLYFRKTQQAVVASNVIVVYPNSATAGAAVLIERHSSFPTPRVSINNLTLVQNNANAVAGISCADSALVVRVEGLARDGSSYNLITPVTGAGTSGVSLSQIKAPATGWAGPTGLLASTLSMSQVNSSGQAIGATTGTVYVAAVWLQANTTITNVNWLTGATAASSPTHWWFGILDNTGKQLAHTADQTTGAIAANSLVTKALSAPYTTTYTGLYYISVSVTASTNPSSSGVAAPTNMAVVPPILGGVSPSAAQTTPGTDGSTSYTLPTAAGGIPYMYLT